MNRKEYGLLIEGWRKFLNESEELSARNHEAYKNKGVEFKVFDFKDFDDFPDFDDSDNDDNNDNDVKQKYWGEIGYLPIGGIGSFKKGMYAMDLRNGGRGDTDYPIKYNPFHEVCAKFFMKSKDELVANYGEAGAENHLALFVESVNSNYNKYGLKKMNAILSDNETERGEQLEVIFSVLQKHYPKLTGLESVVNTITDADKDKEKIKKYRDDFWSMSEANDSRLRGMFAEMVTALREENKLLEQSPGGENKS